jgi:hypothetical protein
MFRFEWTLALRCLLCLIQISTLKALSSHAIPRLCLRLHYLKIGHTDSTNRLRETPAEMGLVLGFSFSGETSRGSLLYCTTYIIPEIQPEWYFPCRLVGFPVHYQCVVKHYLPNTHVSNADRVHMSFSAFNTWLGWLFFDQLRETLRRLYRRI